ncbi:hypothetical protein [Nocardioides rubriscoriae]|uniref:hypothetical protein n=1 Tax=Nocardioides rubriscoriae TaxID=642762 RepID=UPI001FE636D0|nr:hypothetical protein [Nocardioides rubriscoriae]
MDDVSYGALALALSLVAGTWTWFAYRRRGLGAGLMGAGLTLLPIAAYLTRTLRLVGEVGSAIGRWATSLVLSPVVWAGIVLAGIAVVLFGAGRAVEARGGGKPRRPAKVRGDERLELPGTTPASGTTARRTPTVDDDLADIEALLKNRGIT